ncbi:MAG: alpha/beta hydrolase [Chloroflexi bacterium]|nr:alpha/beta hydrolase [Chloroflexota bacterium]
MALGRQRGASETWDYRKITLWGTLRAIVSRLSSPSQSDELTNTEVDRRPNAGVLAVLLHGWYSSPEDLRDVASAVREAIPDSDLLSPGYDESPASNVDPVRLTERVLDLIDRAVEEKAASGQPYQRIVLIGHSIGALLAKKVYVFARGQTQDGSGNLRRTDRPWAMLVDRIILLAGMNRGWNVWPKPRHMSWKLWIWAVPILPLGELLPVGDFLLRAKRGSPFVSNLRIQWLNLAREEPPLPLTVQILGDRDAVVDLEDHIDLQSGAKFVYREVDRTSHMSVLHFREGRPDREREFLYALTEPPETIKSSFEVPGSDRIDPSVDGVVLVLHGIRERAVWTPRIGESVATAAKAEGLKFARNTESYGTFAMLPFLLRYRRQKHVRWFMDQYTELRARYPRAAVNVVAHSNGTYIVASALRRYAACDLRHVALAGSIIPRRFEWNRMMRDGRVAAVKNYAASADTVVAVAGGLYELWSSSEIGSSGFNLFIEDGGKRGEVAFIKGSHGAAIQRENDRSIARFIVHGDSSEETAPQTDRQNVLSDFLSRQPWVAVVAGIVALLMLGSVVSTVAASGAHVSKRRALLLYWLLLIVFFWLE